MIEISARHSNREDAKIVAEAVYQAYEIRRNDLERGVRQRQLEAIEIELQSKSDKVSELRKNLMDVAQRVGIIWVDDERGGQTFGGKMEIRDLAERQLHDANIEKDEISSQINKLLTLTDDELVPVAADLPDVGFKETFNQYTEAKQNLEVLKPEV